MLAKGIQYMVIEHIASPVLEIRALDGMVVVPCKIFHDAIFQMPLLLLELKLALLAEV